MRHTCASLLASPGVSIYKIAKWLGDDVRTVQRIRIGKATYADEVSAR